MVDDVIDRMARQRLVFIHGASGSGKSSLVRAGVLPRLAHQHLRYGTQWLTCTMRPSGGPLWNLAQELARLEGRADDISRIGEIIRLFNRRDATLSSIIGMLEGIGGKRLSILVDQFEELFRFEREKSREEAELFVSLLTGLIAPLHGDDAPALTRPERDADIHIIITMRSEFLGDCSRYDGLAEAFNLTQYLVPRMRREALVRAIRRPAELYGGAVTAELADRLIADVRGREDELPLLQHGLMQMWHEAKAADPDGRIVLDADRLTITGGLAALLSERADVVMQQAVAEFDRMAARKCEGSPPTLLARAEDLFARYVLRRPLQRPLDGATVVERLFRALTDINADGRAIRRPQRFGTLVVLCGTSADDLRRVLDAFRSENVSFLSPYAPAAIDDDTVIDIGHEALIRCWSKVADPQHGWLQREFSDGLVWRSLLVQADAFKGDRRQMLSPATAKQRTKWLNERMPLWSIRYGGNWPSVEDLVQTSQRRGVRGERFRRIFILVAAYIVVSAVVLSLLAVIRAASSIDPSSLVSRFFAEGFLAFIFAWIVLLMMQVVFDYLRQLSDWLARRGLGRDLIAGIGWGVFWLTSVVCLAVGALIGAFESVSSDVGTVLSWAFLAVTGLAAGGLFFSSWSRRRIPAAASALQS